jgi:sulfur-oxidizing protein SoxZ
MADPMRIRAVAKGDTTEVRVLMAHEMETGTRKDASGKLVPAHFISNVTVTYAGKIVLAAEWGPAVSKNPFLQFSFAGGKKGEEITVTWVDNKGESRTDKAVIN